MQERLEGEAELLGKGDDARRLMVGEQGDRRAAPPIAAGAPREVRVARGARRRDGRRPAKARPTGTAHWCVRG